MIPGRKSYGFSDVSSHNHRRNYGTNQFGRAGLCVHSTMGTDSLQWLLYEAANSGNPASADYLIRRDGFCYRLTQEGRYAYHAGESIFYFDGREYRDDDVSNLLVGVELEQTAEQVPTLEQYDALGQLYEKLRILYSLPMWYPVVGHYAVARPMGRRSDPVNFDWNQFRRYTADETK